jgi:hypothetical protein
MSDIVQRFFDKYNAQPLDADGAFGTQCVDVQQQYSKEVLGIGYWGSGNAVGRWTTYPKQHFDLIPYSKGKVPQKGDIVVWSAWTGNQYGHIAIASGEGNATKFVCFGANWPVGDICGYDWYTYANVLGWLRPKKFAAHPPSNNEQEAEMRIIEAFRKGIIDIVRVNGTATVAITADIDSFETYKALTGQDSINAREIPRYGNLSEVDNRRVSRVMDVLGEINAEKEKRIADVQNLSSDVSTERSRAERNAQLLASAESELKKVREEAGEAKRASEDSIEALARKVAEKDKAIKELEAEVAELKAKPQDLIQFIKSLFIRK